MGSPKTDFSISQIISMMESVCHVAETQSPSARHQENEQLKSVKDEILAILQLDESILERLDHSGRSVLHHMMSFPFPGRMDVLNCMRSISSFNVNICDFELKTPLHYALNMDNIRSSVKMCNRDQQSSCGSLFEIVKFLLDCGADVGALDYSKVSPLYLALDYIPNKQQPEVHQEIPEIVRMLLSSSDSLGLYCLEEQGRNHVFFACMLEGPYALPIMKSFINRENVEEYNLAGVPLLVSVISSSSKDDDLVLEKVSFLVSVGADVNLSNVEGPSALSSAFGVREPLIEPLVLLLVSNGAKIDQSFSEGTSFFHEACKARMFDIFKNLPLFVKAGANMYAFDLCGSLALHEVICRITKQEEFDCLVSSGVDVDLTDNAGNNALNHLHVVPSNDVLKMLAKRLIAQGCSVNHKNDRGETPLLCFLQSHGKHPSSEYIQTLIDLGASVNCQNHEGIAPLHIASRILRKGNNEIFIDMLLNAGADVNLLDDQMNSALHYALRDGQTVDTSLVAKLIGAGCDPNIRNRVGVTPLHVACFSTAEGAVEILLDNGADINAQVDSGSTPLHFIASKKNVPSTALSQSERVCNIMRLLISRLADLTIKNYFCFTPFAACINCAGSTNYLILYVALLATAGKYLMNHIENELLKKTPRFQADFEKCLNCARSMKTRPLGDSSIALLDFLIMDDVDAARILRNASIKEDLAGQMKIEENYTVYEKFIVSKVSRCQKLERMLSSAERVLSQFCFERPLPAVATDKIIRLLNEKDLNTLSESVLFYAS